MSYSQGDPVQPGLLSLDLVRAASGSLSIQWALDQDSHLDHADVVSAAILPASLAVG
jgi:hypothetical protein